MFEISVIICTYNPQQSFLDRVLQSIRSQTLQMSHWELIIIDNNSSNNFQEQVDLSWHPNARIILESNPGLTHARLRGAKEANGEIIVGVDDDNILDKDYLKNTLNILSNHPELGAIGGKVIPEYEQEPAPWFHQLNISLGCRDLGNESQTTNFKGREIKEYPAFAPIGTGMVVRKKVFLEYAKEASTDPIRKALGRTGKALTSGEDNDIVLTVLKNGYEVGYFPELYIDHIIPSDRLTFSYLSRMNFASSRSWVQVLSIHGLSPWPPIPAWSLPLRKLRAYFRLQAWKDQLRYIKWRGSCGILEGQASI